MLFEKNHKAGSAQTRRIYALYEIAYTLVDFSAAFLFIIGSVMFFYPAWETTGVWMFLIGSIFFAFKPTLRLVRELRLAASGNKANLADRFEGEL